MKWHRPALIVAAGMLVAAAAAEAQTPPAPNSFRYGVSYAFETATAMRVVDDQHDRGPISLTVYIWKPRSAGNGHVVLFSHGSTGGGSIHPKEPVEYMPRPLIKYFVDRGYTVALPIRRGLGPSTGNF